MNPSYFTYGEIKLACGEDIAELIRMEVEKLHAVRKPHKSRCDLCGGFGKVKQITRRKFGSADQCQDFEFTWVDCPTCRAKSEPSSPSHPS